MKNILSLIAAILLTFLAIALLMAAVQYSSDLIGVKSQNTTIMPSDINVEGTTNSTGGNSHDSSGSPRIAPQNNGWNGFNIVNLSSLSFNSGGPDNPDPDPINYLLLILIILIIVAIVALVGYIIWRRRRGQKKLSVSEKEISVLPPPASFEGDYRIRFPQIHAPFPAIWGEGESLEVAIESIYGAASKVELDVDGSTREVALEEGGAQFRLKLDKGDHRIQVSTPGSPGVKGSSWAIVRVVDYREEVVRMFNEMYLNYRSRYEGIGDTMTPREIEQAIGPGMPEAKRKALSAAVTVFELANYSLHGIRRMDFEKMYMSKIDVS